MFCPRCSIENNLEQKYCRKCGLQLTAARMALQGTVDEALAKYKKGARLLSGGSFFLILSALAALANIFLNSAPWNYGVVINLLIGLTVTVPIISVGLVRLRSAQRALQPGDEPAQLRGGYPRGGEKLAASAHPADRLFSPAETPASITEGTTRHLTIPERER